MNKTVLNKKKKKAKVTASSQKLSTLQENICVTLSGSSIDAVSGSSVEKLLGIYFDQTCVKESHRDWEYLDILDTTCHIKFVLLFIIVKFYR